MRIVLLVLCVALFAPPALAWKDGLDGRSRPIAEMLEQVEIGDWFVVEGTVVDKKGSNPALVRLRDDSGDLLVRLPNHVVRDTGMPERGERVRVAGKFDRKKLDHRVEGMRVQQLERLGKGGGGYGAAAPEAVTPSVSDEDSPAPPAAAATPEKLEVYSAEMSEEWIEKLRSARQGWLAARAEQEEAGGAYARAVHAAGSEEAAGRSVVERLHTADEAADAAHAEMVRTANEASAAGVPADVMRIYERAGQAN